MEFLQDVGAKLSDSRVLVTAVLQAKQGWGRGGGGGGGTVQVGSQQT